MVICDNKITFLALYVRITLNSFFCIMSNYRKFIVNVILSVVALYLVGLLIGIIFALSHCR